MVVVVLTLVVVVVVVVVAVVEVDDGPLVVELVGGTAVCEPELANADGDDDRPNPRIMPMLDSREIGFSELPRLRTESSIAGFIAWDDAVVRGGGGPSSSAERTLPRLVPLRELSTLLSRSLLPRHPPKRPTMRSSLFGLLGASVVVEI